MSKRLTTEEWIEKASAIHGDRYDYSKTVYCGATSPITFVCNKCGHVNNLNQARQHTDIKPNGSSVGCEVCYSTLRCRDKNTFLVKLFSRYPEFKDSDFREFKYELNSIKSQVTCAQGHIYRIRPNDLLSGYGCPTCGKLKITGRKPIGIPLEAVSALLDKGLLFDLTNYKTSSSMVACVCTTCHYSWSSRASSLFRNPGCPSCNNKEGNKKLRKSFQYYSGKARKKFDGKYTYIESTFVGSKAPMVMVCPVHGRFELSMARHLVKGRSSGCPKCAVYGFNATKSAALYYLKIGDNYKIGITNRSVDLRFNKSDKELIEGYVQVLADGVEVREIEKEALEAYKEHLYSGPDILSSGNTEIFTENVLGIPESEFIKLGS